jgi:LSD1 subclass zinc finger protein
MDGGPVSDASALCECRCHVNGTAGCDLEHDKGSSGVQGVPSCSPCEPPTCELCDNEREFGVVCRRHYHWIDRVLTQIVELAALVPFHNPVGDVGRSGTPDGSPAPGNLYAMALTHVESYTVRADRGEDYIPDVRATLANWARYVSDERDQQPDGYDPTVMEAVSMLRRHRHWISQQPRMVTDYTDDLDLVHRHLASVTGAGKWPESIGACPNCDTPLHVTTGADSIRCRRCKAQWAGVDLVRLRLILEQREGA